jgi:hypothetical protein
MIKKVHIQIIQIIRYIYNNILIIRQLFRNPKNILQNYHLNKKELFHLQKFKALNIIIMIFKNQQLYINNKINKRI